MAYAIYRCEHIIRGLVKFLLSQYVTDGTTIRNDFLDIPIHYVYWKDEKNYVDAFLARHILNTLSENDSSIKSKEFRAVSPNLIRFYDILTNGVDVVPTSNCMYTGEITKAIEYGGCPKLMMAFDGNNLDRTWRCLSLDISKDKHDKVAKDFPYHTLDPKNNCMWYSRVEDIYSRHTEYEHNYARWIPGDPRKALTGLLLIDNNLPCDSSSKDILQRLVEIVNMKPSCGLPIIK